MSTIENPISVSSTIPSHYISHHLSISTKHNHSMTGEYSSSNPAPSTDNVYVSFAKDEKQYLTPYDKLLYDAQYDARFKAEENAGRRIGFYRIQKDIGSGNFSRVKLGLHLLAKGKNISQLIIFPFNVIH